MLPPIRLLGPRAASLNNSAQYQRGVDAAEAERIRENVLHALCPPRARQKIKIAGVVRNLKIDGRRQPLVLHRQRADSSLDRAGGAERVPVVALRSAYGDGVRVITHDFLDRRRLRSVIERGRAPVRIDVTNL